MNQPNQRPRAPGAAPVAQATQDAEVVVLAVPWSGVREVVGQTRDWSGQILIDCTNPIGPGFALAVGFDTSGSEKVARWAAGARVAKAFNTTGFNNMRDPVYDGKPAAMLFSTDDPAAQETTAQLIRDVGFEPAFVGAVKQARYLEPLAMLWIAMSQSQGRDFAFTLVRR
jgi:predicted dinucleotide-binding enzyme